MATLPSQHVRMNERTVDARGVVDKGTAVVHRQAEHGWIRQAGTQGLGLAAAGAVVVGWRYVVKFLKTALCSGAP